MPQLVSMRATLAALMLAACADPAPQMPGDARAHILADMPVWTVPAGVFRVHEPGAIQVRLSPKVELDEALLTASSSSPELTIDPAAGITIRNLKPAPSSSPAAPSDPPPPPQLRKPGEPPALGITLLRSFKVTVNAPGDYKVRVTLRFRDVVQVQNIVIGAQ